MRLICICIHIGAIVSGLDIISRKVGFSRIFYIFLNCHRTELHDKIIDDSTFVQTSMWWRHLAFQLVKDIKLFEMRRSGELPSHCVVASRRVASRRVAARHVGQQHGRVRRPCDIFASI